MRISVEAQQLAYRAGAKALEPFIQRVLDLEKRVQELERAQQPPHMRNVEKR